MVVAGVLLIVLAYEVYRAFQPQSTVSLGLGHDYQTYMTAVRSWLGGGPFYPAFELAGPYVVADHEVLYPPIILPLLALFSLLPAFLWWAIPTAILAGVVYHWRPNANGVVGIMACLAVPQGSGTTAVFDVYANGNPGIWIVAFIAMATVWGWPGVLVALKPTLAPFMLVGVRHRSWWLAAGLLAIISLVMLPLWFEYLRVLLNARGPLDSPLYSLPDVPLMLIPIIAWLTAGRPERGHRGPGIAR